MQYQNQRNPVLPLACHVPDGEAHVMPDGALYVYGSWDDGEKYYCSGEYHVGGGCPLGRRPGRAEVSRH